MTPDFSVPDWFDKLKSGLPPIPDIALNEAEAAKAVGIFNNLRLPDVPGQPRLADAAGDWSRDVVRLIFGTVITDDGGAIVGRTAKKFFELVPKKNAKTTKGAAIMLTALLMNRRPRAEFILVGPTQETADLAFSQITGMIEADDEGYLAKRFHVQDHKKTIVDRINKAKLKIKTFDNKVMTGAKPAGVLIDEIHELGKMAYAQKVMAQIIGGILPNPEAFVVIITTQSDEPPTGLFKSELDYARDIRDGKVKGDTVPILYEFPVEMQADPDKPWENPELWPLVLPNLGRSVHVADLVKLHNEARDKGVDEESIFASQHLNIQIGIAINRDGWAGAPFWLEAEDPQPITVDSLIERCEVIVAGGDGGGLDDLLGLALCGRDKVTKDWLFLYRAWAHPSVLKRRKEIADRLKGFAKDGHIRLCPADDPTLDLREFADILEKVHLAGKFPDKAAIGLDPVGVAAIIDELVGRGIEPEKIIGVPQGYKLSGTIKGFERKLSDGTLWHDGSELMKWCVGNAKVERRGNADLITKQVSGVAKIDPLLAGFNAFSLMSLNPDAAGGDVTPWDSDETYSMVA